MLYIEGVSECIENEALHGSVSRFLTSGSMVEYFRTVDMK